MKPVAYKNAIRALLAIGFSFACAPKLLAQQLNATDNKSETPARPSAQAQSPAPAWSDAITGAVQVEGGFMGNPGNPSDGQNYGQLFSDKASNLLLNHVLLTIQRQTDPSATGYDFGFVLQAAYGSNARYNHVLGIDDYLLKGRNQLIPTSLYAMAHLPWFASGGVDVKAGIMPAMMGFEAFDPTVRIFYTYSYISNYIIPFFNTGGQATVHLSDTFDLFLGADTGNQTSFGRGDNNRAAAGYLGFGLNKLMDGKLNIVLMSRFGPEDPILQYPNADNYMRSWNDLVATYKHDDQWSFTGEVSVLYDRGLSHRTAYGAAAYASYAYDSEFTFNGRAEVLRDNTNSLVGNYPGNTDYVRSLAGLSSGFYSASAPTTYSEFSFNVVFKPKVDWARYNLPIKNFQLRPEVRYDRTLNGTSPYNAGKSRDMLMLGGDVVIGF